MHNFVRQTFFLFVKYSRCSYRGLSSKVKCTASLDPSVEQSLKDGLKAKRHPGIRDHSCIELPERLEKAAKRVLRKYERKELETNSEDFLDRIKQRLPPVDEYLMKGTLQNIREAILQKEKVPLETLDQESRKKAENRIKWQSLTRLKQIVNTWKPFEYNEHESYLYLYGRLAPNFSVLKTVFAEIKAKMPTFTPRTVFDFGSGLGTVTWAAFDAWGENVKEYFCVDASAEMNNLAQLLLQDGNPNQDPFLKGLFFRQFLPASMSLGYDLVICSWSLLDLPSIHKRLEVIDNLWSRTQYLLVLIEFGTNQGYSCILEARDYILNQSMKTGVFADRKGDVLPASVLCPCPHDMACPRYANYRGIPCSFAVKYHKLSLTEKQDITRERFSYVVLRKEFRSPDEDHWPRIVREVLKRSGHTICRMCCSDGNLNEVIFTKSKSGKEMYNCAKASNWGDLLPAKVYRHPDDHSRDDNVPDSSSDSDTEETSHHNSQESLKT